MSLYAYKVFRAVIEHGTFAGAAEALNLTPSAVSHIVAKLESDLNLQLFIRNRNGAVLTSVGTTLLPLIQELQLCDERLKQEVACLHDLDSGIVRIGTFNSITVQWLSHIFYAFHHLYPKIDVQVYQGGDGDVARWFCDNTVDIAFLSKTTLENEDISGAYNMIPIHRDQIMCVVPKTFVPKNNVYATAEDIADFPLVMQRTGYDQETLYVLKKYNLKSSSNFHIADDNSIIAMVEAGLGICIMPELVCKSSTCNVDIYPFFPEEYRTIMLLVRNSQQQMPAVSKMQHQILNYLQENGLMNC